MAGPFVYIGHHRIKDGKREEALRNARAVVDLVREREPQMLAFDFFVNSDGTAMTVVQVHPDVASMNTHMGIIREHLENFSDYLEITGVGVYGEGTDDFVEVLREITGPGAALDVKNTWLGGIAARNRQELPA